MSSSLTLAALILIVCILFTRVSKRLGISVLLLFILIGIFFGSEGVVGVPFSDYALAESLSSIGLAIIIFYGGFGTNWNYAKPHLSQGVLLSSLGTVMTAGLLAVAGHFLLGLSWTEAFILGAVISSTDAASVFNILRTHRLNLKNGLAPLLEVESGSNDPFAFTLIIIGISLLSGNASSSVVVSTTISQILFGLIFGALMGFFAWFVLKRISFGEDGLDSLFILAISLLSYTLPTFFNGNGFIAVYLAGIIIGNSPIGNKIELVHFFDGLTQLSQIIIFFLFGLLVFPSRLPFTLLNALIIFLVLTLVIRPLMAIILLKSFKRSFREIVFLSAAGLRGASSLVFAVFVVSLLSKNATPLSFDLYHTVFWIVVFSSLIQGSMIPFAAKKLDLIDNRESVMKSFNDYTAESDYDLLEMTIAKDSHYDGLPIKDANFPNNALAVALERDAQNIIPTGSTIMQANDKLILSGTFSLTSPDSIGLIEYPLKGKHPWINHKLADLSLSPQAIVVMIRRNGTLLVPDGKTKLYVDDTLIINGEIPSDPQSVVQPWY
ncbi:MAG: potassium/proton antiporter [Coriobacteriia bacterium]|nr:potassium/proton antiporter [Coriobacteriia bacterium]